MDKFLFNLSLVLGHSVVYELKSILSPYGIVDDARNGGDPPAPTVGQSTNEQLQAYIQNLPNLAQTTSSQVLPTEQALQNASNVISPQQQQQALDLFSQYAPQFNQIGNTINAQNAQAQASSDLGVLQGPGQQLLSATDQAQRQLDPEYYATRTKTANSLSDLLGSINLNGLSGSERAEVERANAQSDASRGLANTPSQTATVSNAMNFGSALNTKRSQLANAIGAATNFLPSSQGSVSAFQVATGKPSSNPGATQFSGPASNLGSQAFSLGNNLLGNINQTALNSANINANRRDTLDRVNGTLSSLPNVSL